MSQVSNAHPPQSWLEQIATNPNNLSKLEAIAESGDTEAMYVLGWCYFKGEYLAKDLDKSMYWLQKAKALGDDRAEELAVYCRFLQLISQ